MRSTSVQSSSIPTSLVRLTCGDIPNRTHTRRRWLAPSTYWNSLVDRLWTLRCSCPGQVLPQSCLAKGPYLVRLSARTIMKYSHLDKSNTYFCFIRWWLTVQTNIQIPIVRSTVHSYKKKKTFLGRSFDGRSENSKLWRNTYGIFSKDIGQPLVRNFTLGDVKTLKMKFQ